MKKHYRHENDCLNCGAELQGHFCHVCGQENLQIKENFGHLMNHAISDYFHFDEKFFHTLVPLLFKPGKLTVDYMAGKRTQYLHPVRVYIFISLIYFLLLFNNSGEEKKTAAISNKKFNKEHYLDSLYNSLKKMNKNGDTSGIDIGGMHITRQQLKEGAVDVKVSKDGKDTTANIIPYKAAGKLYNSKDTTYEQYLQKQQKLPEAERDGFLTRLSNKKNIEWRAKGIEPKDAVLESFRHNFPKLMFFLLPMFAFLLRLAFWKNHKFYVEHLIYAFHLHCFLFLFLTIVMLIKMPLPANWGTIPGWIDFLAVVAIVWYIYRSLRVLYNRSRWRTVSKMIGLSFMYLITSSIAAGLFLGLVALFT